MPPQLLSLLCTALLLLIPSISALDFILHNFNSSRNFLFYGNATIESSTLTLTTDSTFSIGRALYPYQIFTTPPNSSYIIPFSSSFIFSISPFQNYSPGDGFAFVLVPTTGIDGASSAQYLGLLNSTNNGNSDNNVFAIEFDVSKNEEFNDIDDNHVGVNVNSLNSSDSHTAGYWGGDNDEVFNELKLNNGVNYQVWIDYSDSQVNVTMAPAGQKRPNRPLINATVDLSPVLLDEMYLGFTGATGQLVESHSILCWSFGPWNFSIGDPLVKVNSTSFAASSGSVVRSKWFVAGVSVVCAFAAVFLVVVGYVVLVRLKRKKKGWEGMEDWESQYWPHRIGYTEIEEATKGFSEENEIGCGANGKVYKGVLAGGAEVAVKRISHETEYGMKEFLAEVSSLGRLKHRNLVGLRGWCKREEASLILVYDYMENGSLDKRILECKESMMLSWDERVKALKDVACGILYLHEGWDVKVLHRDIKASNVLLDKDMNARLGDFGLARMHQHGELATTTQIVGTVGYMAPEVVRTGRASAETDVFGFGVLVLEVVSGRRPIEEGKPGLVEWVWSLMERGELICALDERLKAEGGYTDEEVEKVLHLGLLCVYPEAQIRPTMRQVVKALEGTIEGIESEGEGMEVTLLDKNKTRAMWSDYRRNFGGGGHPTFEEIQKSLSYSTSLSRSGSYNIGEGR
ncbi:hypothetical protein L1049_023424 [Liquidambar formosana]|uniref:non-specific serine/threonine protein kinase n=1 Tax=Liquidambar formosana TaxID=63359 RepID=A0AAP0S006_LIQFO